MKRRTNATNITPPRAERSMAPAQDLEQNTLALAEQERHRTLVLLGLPESAAALPSERVQEDRKVATKILDHLDVEAEPTAVFRLGRYDPQRTTPRPPKWSCLHRHTNTWNWRLEA
ncbi:hypothetical protein niasHT_030392 [Heterodera trifolii]|uniref:Uncharacterized protein n=1 Tax=Heterodera trifolii TaxID=157864 RepID=A0ABD2KU37_9BILA